VNDELVGRSAAELSSLIATRQLSPVEVVDAFLARIHHLNPALNAFCLIAEESAKADARRAEMAIQAGEAHGPLHGVPVAIKDVNLTAGLRTTFGSRAFADFVPPADSASVANLREAGAIVIGKTTTPEFGCKGVCESPLLGRTNNPWHLDYTPGGSSGGAAAAIAAGLVPLTDGSDGAGSIRIPASFCGVVGFKPSFGRIPIYPRSVYESLVHVGPITRTVRDATLMFGAMCGQETAETMGIRTATGASFVTEADVEGWRIAFSPDLGLACVDAEVSDRVRDAAAAFTALGAEVEEITPELPDPREPMMTMWKSTYGVIGRDRILPVVGRDEIDPDLVQLIDGSMEIDAYTYYRAAVVFRAEFANAMARFFERYRLLLTPSVAVLPMKHPPNGHGLNPAGLDGTDAERFLGWVLTYPFNLTGQPALSMPCGISTNGFPIGLQIAGAFNADLDVLRAGAALERVNGPAELANPLIASESAPIAPSPLIV
jgi:aspartyl-tRNA(Asn)/glutamyl-tRNA(Gln) amidotransferase subunit A